MSLVRDHGLVLSIQLRSRNRRLCTNNRDSGGEECAERVDLLWQKNRAICGGLAGYQSRAQKGARDPLRNICILCRAVLAVMLSLGLLPRSKDGGARTSPSLTTSLCDSGRQTERASKRVSALSAGWQ